MRRRAAARVADVPGGFAFLRPEIERAYTENAFWLTDARGRDAATVEADAEHFLGGLRHRMVFAESGAGAALEEGFEALGYETTKVLVMAHALDGAGLDAGPAVEVARDDAMPAVEHHLLTDPDFTPGRDDEVRAHLVEHHRSFGERSGAAERWFGVRRDGGVVAYAKLWQRRGVAQVEDVVCLHEHRGHGFGRAVVAAATLAALADAPEVLFILAADDDWPKELYARLGYATAGTLHEFVRG